jgi:hypothetical protein
MRCVAQCSAGPWISDVGTARVFTASTSTSPFRTSTRARQPKFLESRVVAQWVKPFGTTEPPTRIEDDWVAARDVDLDAWHIISGPDQRNPPAMGTSDK